MTIRKLAITALTATALAAAMSTAQADPQPKAVAAAHAANEHELTRFCDSPPSCRTFCEKACDLNVSAWKTTCSRIPQHGKGMIPDDSKSLMHVPKMKHVSVSGGVRATQDVIDGLKRLDEYLDDAPTRKALGYKVHVNNCYRSAAFDTERECDFVLKGWHIKDKWANRTPVTDHDKQEKANGDRWVNPNNVGLAWPGASYHSAGNACDIVLVDAAGAEATACSAHDKSIASKILPVQRASKLLDEALTNDRVGARRLNFEMWHYEWNGGTSCRCKAPECAEKHWPPRCAAADCEPHR